MTGNATANGLDISQIIDLETQVATGNSVQATIGGDDIFNLIISIAHLIVVLEGGR